MYIISFIPILLYLIILKSLDSFKLVKWKVLGWCILCGIVSCAIAFGINQISTKIGIPFYSPLVEEFIKALAAILLMRKFKLVFFAEALCYGAAIGGGFALLENMIYLTFNPAMLPATAIFRGLVTAMLHIGCTALFLTLFVQFKDKIDVCNSEETESVSISVHTAHLRMATSPIHQVLQTLTILPSIAIHAVYNLQLFSPLIHLFLVICTFLIIFLFINKYNEQRIGRWLDRSIMYDTQLLSGIYEGKLAESNTGKYLLSIKGQFDAEVFLDIICYIQVYLELTIAAKSRIMLREAGLPAIETTEDSAKRKAMVKEFHTLRINIGRMGEMVLRPIVKLSREDLKAMEL